MHKKSLLTALVGLSLLVTMVGCGKKSDASDVAPVNTDSAAVAPAKTEFGDDVNKEEANSIVAQLTSKFPQIQISKVQRAPVSGFYQVIAGGDILYVSNNAEHLFVGDLLAINRPVQTNLTEEVRKESRLAVLKDLSEKDMVVYNPKSGNPDYTVTVFTDIDCGYCRKFHQELNSYLDQNIKIRYLSFPRAGIGSDSYNKAKTVWCAEDRNKVMDEAKLNNDFKAATDLCATDAIDKSMELVRKLGLNGTPALLLDDGTLLPGYMPASALKSTLDGLKQAATANHSTANTTTTAG
jgi:thiol:disulfide interchange protein DsbC